jgi:carboxyl-terminal processing protease
MPRRNLHWLTLVTLLSLVCYQRVPGNRCSRVLADNLDTVVRRYFRPVEPVELFEGAMAGMMKRLDEHSTYIPAAKKQKFENDVNQQFVGIGVLLAVDPKTKRILVLAPLPDGPAAAAGVRSGDDLLKIDGHALEALAIDDVSQRVRGKPGTSVNLTVQHRGDPQPVELAVVRRMIHEDTIQGTSRGPDGRWEFLLPGPARIGYVRITAFVQGAPGEKSTAADLRAALEQLAGRGIRGLVLDLRDDPGGVLQAAVDVCDLFIAHGAIVTMRDRNHRVMRSFRASGKAPFTDLPVAVLVNGRSASASEIVAACLQDSGRAVVAGERTYGKGTVQDRIDLGPSLGEMKLTVATYWRPSGQDIHRPKDDDPAAAWGVVPNEGFEVRVDKKERERLAAWLHRRQVAAVTGETLQPSDEVPDRVLLRAVEHLEAEAKAKGPAASPGAAAEKDPNGQAPAKHTAHDSAAVKGPRPPSATSRSGSRAGTASE